jgi:hypothetical protein
MTSDNKVPPTFSADPSSTPDTSLASFMPQGADTRAFTPIDFTNDRLSDVTLEAYKYYIPTASSNPLFDSFTINTEDPSAVVICIFQITISTTYGGSNKGYLQIRKIMAHVYNLLGENSNVKVKVAYFLVCPHDGSKYMWQMPAGWDKNTTTHSHRGDCFCIRVPVPRYVTVFIHSQFCDRAES